MIFYQVISPKVVTSKKTFYIEDMYENYLIIAHKTIYNSQIIQFSLFLLAAVLNYWTLTHCVAPTLTCTSKNVCYDFFPFFSCNIVPMVGQRRREEGDQRQTVILFCTLTHQVIVDKKICMVRSVYPSTIKPKFDDSRNQLWGLFGSNGLKFSLVIPNIFMPIRRTKYKLIVKLIA